MVQVPQVSPSTLVIRKPVHGQLGTVVHLGQRNVLRQRGDESEHLERRPGLQLRLGEVVTGAVLAAVVGTHAAGLGVDRNDGRTQFLGFADEDLPHRVDRGLLRLGVDGGGDLQPAGVELFLVDTRRGDLVEHPCPDQALGPARLRAAGDLVERDDPRELDRGAVGKGQRVRRDHPVEHIVPARLQFGQMCLGIEPRRRANHRGQHRALRDRQLADRLTEVGVGGGGDAVGTAPEVDGVQVGGKDLVLGPLPRHLRRDDQLLELSFDGAVGARRARS